MDKWKCLPLFVSFCVLTFSCSEERLYEKFHSLEASKWNMTDTLAFDIHNIPLEQSLSLLSIRFNDTYPYSNCYVRVIEIDSLGDKLTNRLLNFPLFDSKSGHPLGKGFGSTFTKYDTLPFDLSPEAQKIILLQYMRQESLPGLGSHRVENHPKTPTPLESQNTSPKKPGYKISTDRFSQSFHQLVLKK